MESVIRRLAHLLLVPVFAMAVVIHGGDSLAQGKSPQGLRTFGKGTPFTVENPSIRDSHGRSFSTASANSGHGYVFLICVAMRPN